MTFILPPDVGQRPVTIDGAGILGRRIAAVYVAGGTDVHIHDVSLDQLEACRRFVSENMDRVRNVLDVPPSRGAGSIVVHEELDAAVPGSWMVIEAVPEDLDLKRQVMGQLDRLSDSDAILAGLIHHPEGQVASPHDQRGPSQVPVHTAFPLAPRRAGSTAGVTACSRQDDIPGQGYIN